MSPVVEGALPPAPPPVPPVPVVPPVLSFDGQPKRPMDRTAAIRTNHLFFIVGFLSKRRHSTSEIHPHALRLRVLLQRVLPLVAAEAGLLEAAERQGRVV